MRLFNRSIKQGVHIAGEIQKNAIHLARVVHNIEKSKRIGEIISLFHDEFKLLDTISFYEQELSIRMIIHLKTIEGNLKQKRNHLERKAKILKRSHRIDLEQIGTINASLASIATQFDGLKRLKHEIRKTSLEHKKIKHHIAKHAA